jgi:adenosylcobinamide kinase/adenosylcobinamide-phosphate guanylyltransferase
MRTLITGGVKSGKSRFSLELAESQFSGGKIYLATAIAFDDELRRRIELHKRERDSSYRTIEEPVDIQNVSGENILLDCITMWMNNLFYYHREEEWRDLLAAFLENLGSNAIIVTNEVGLGNIPADETSRRYNEYLGRANNLLASHADRVFLMVSGIPLKVK